MNTGLDLLIIDQDFDKLYEVLTILSHHKYYDIYNDLIIKCLENNYLKILNICEPFALPTSSNAIFKYIIKNYRIDCIEQLSLLTYDSIRTECAYLIIDSINMNCIKMTKFLLDHGYKINEKEINYNINNVVFKNFYDLFNNYDIDIINLDIFVKEYIQELLNSKLNCEQRLLEIINKYGIIIPTELFGKILENVSVDFAKKYIKFDDEPCYINLTYENVDKFIILWNDDYINKDLTETDIRQYITDIIDLDKFEFIQVLLNMINSYIPNHIFRHCIFEGNNKMFKILLKHNNYLSTNYFEILTWVKLFNNTELETFMLKHIKSRT